MAENPKELIDEMVSKAHREIEAPETVKVATGLVFNVSPERQRELDTARKLAEERLFLDKDPFANE
jgi:hypothetical protein